MTVVPVSYPDSTVPFFPSNWVRGVRMTSAWKTDVARGVRTGSEERRGLLSRPVRVLEVLLHGMEEDEAYRLQYLAQQRTRLVTPFPLYQDKIETWSQSLVALPTPTSTISCDVPEYRITSGQRIIAVEPGASTGTLFTVGLTTATYFQILPAVEISETAVLYPALDGEIELSNEVRWLSDGVAEVRLEVVERVGESSLEAASFVTEPPELDGYYLFDVDLDWAAGNSETSFRYGENYSSGRGQVVETHVEETMSEFRCRSVALSRDEAWKLLGFFDAHRGRLQPFWFKKPQAPFRNWIANSSTNVLTFDAYGSTADYQDHLHHVAFTRESGTVLKGDVSSVSSDGTTVTANLDTVPPDLFADPIVDIRPLYLVRFSSDELTETWLNTEVATFSFAVREVWREADREVETA